MIIKARKPKEPRVKKDRRFSIGALFYKDKFVMVFAVFCAFAFWINMSFRDTERNPKAIADVPVSVKLSDAAMQSGLKVFSPVDTKAKVWIKGNSLIVNQVANTDLQVTAPQAASVSAPGNYVFDLSVKKLTNLTDYTVFSIEPSSVNVYVDTYGEKVLSIDKSQIKYQVASTCYMKEPTLSVEEITVSGPQQEVSKVDKAVLIADAGNDPLTETKRITSNITLLDSYGKEITGGTLQLTAETVDITFNVMPRKVLSLSADFVNKPSALIIPQSRIKIEPEEIEIAGPEDALANLTAIQLTPIDFSLISPLHNSFDVDITLPATFKNVSNISSAKVTLDLSNLSTRTMAINTGTIKFRNLGADREAQVNTQSLNVIVVGPESEISKLTENNLVAQIDMTGKEEFTGQTEMPVMFSVSGADSSWVSGSYKVNIGVEIKPAG